MFVGKDSDESVSETVGCIFIEPVTQVLTAMNFDDLLADPFADPFAQPRSGSPDPWASFSHQRPAEVQEAFTDPSYEDNRSTTPTTESYATGERGNSSQVSLTDPLESAAVNAEDEDDVSAASSTRTPGFRESISALNPADHTQTIAEPEPSTPPASIPSPSLSVAEPTRVSSPPASQSPEQPTSSTPVLPTSASSAASPIVSPLERPEVSPSFNRSFAGLALGGESAGGWQSDQGSWANERPIPPVASASSAAAAEEDDDEDDVPIMQTRANMANATNAVGTLHITYLRWIQLSMHPGCTKRQRHPACLCYLCRRSTEGVGSNTKIHNVHGTYPREFFKNTSCNFPA